VKPPPSQSSQLLPALFRNFDAEQRLHVLHLGPARQDTLDFFSTRRCRLHIVDLFAELPLPAEEDTSHGITAHLRELLQLPTATVFDICLFWDLFNYLDATAMQALIEILSPCIGETTVAHGFSMHNPRTPEQPVLYGIHDADVISIRDRPAAVPGYCPHSQQRLLDLLQCFRMERTVLLADKRLELLLRARTQLESAPEAPVSAATGYAIRQGRRANA